MTKQAQRIADFAYHLGHYNPCEKGKVEADIEEAIQKVDKRHDHNRKSH